MSKLAESFADAPSSSVQPGAAMVETLITQADNEFQQSNFEAASELYVQALSGLEAGEADEKRLAEVLQKLADSEYALNNFEHARSQYKRLVGVQSTNGFSDREKVMPLLKLAKSSDKCDAQDEASENFTAVYELAKKSLPSTHFLNRTVLDTYAEWLRTTGRNPELLVELENALGIDREAAAKAEPVIEEVSAESVKIAGSSSGIAREQEQFVVRKRLKKARKQTPEKSEEEAAAAAAEILKVDKAKPTVDQQVAERKFLRKAETAETGKKTNMRAKLRNALSEDIDAKRSEQKDLPQEDFNPPAREVALQPNQTTQPNAPVLIGETVAEMIDFVAPAEPQQIYVTPLNIEDGTVELATGIDASVAKLMAKKPRRHFSDKLEASRQKADQEAKIMSESSRSFLQHAENVKKALDPNNEMAPDMVQLRTEEHTIPSEKTERVTNVMKFVAPVVVLLLLGGASVMLMKQSTAPRAVSIPHFAVSLLDRKFMTSDGALALTPTRTGVNVGGAALSRTAPVHYWAGDFNDEMALVQGKFKNSKWILPSTEGLRDQNGVIFYAPEAPERKIFETMNNVAKQATEYFTTNADYPSYSTNLTTSSYQNPFTKKSEEVAIFSGVDQRATGSGDGAIDKDLKAGGQFNNETALQPGCIHALSLLSSPTYSGESNNYSWNNHCFYIHACGRDGKLIGSSLPDQTFLVALKNGGTVPLNTQQQSANFKNADICIAEALPGDPNLIIFKYLGSFLFVIVLLLFAMKSSILPGGKRRL